jgi:hypothetical protein
VEKQLIREKSHQSDDTFSFFFYNRFVECFKTYSMSITAPPGEPRRIDMNDTNAHLLGSGLYSSSKTVVKLTQQIARRLSRYTGVRESIGSKQCDFIRRPTRGSVVARAGQRGTGFDQVQLASRDGQSSLQGGANTRETVQVRN